METESKQPYISDASKPNPGRIYDFILKGNHNFAIDREMAEKIIAVIPNLPQMAQFVRWFIGEVVRRTIERGFMQYIDFASGLPTVDHIHSAVPSGTKVIYSDIDPITVRYSTKIIGENPNVKYETCDASTPENLLKSGVVNELFGDNHKVVIGFNGICWFLSDEQISHAMKTLYDWADKGSVLFLTDYDGKNISSTFQAIIDLYTKMNQFIGIRSKEKLLELITPWKLEEPGFLPLEKWFEISPRETAKIIDSIGGGGPFGGILRK